MAVFIPVVLPHEPIGGGLGGPSIPLLGHGSFIIIDDNGNAKFYEYGHWDPNTDPHVITTNTSGNNTNIREFDIAGKVQFDSSGKITETSLHNALDQIFGNPTMYPNDPGEITAIPFNISNSQYSDINSALGALIISVNKGEANYDLFGLNCMSFAYDMATSGNLVISSTQDVWDHITIPSVAGDAILNYTQSGYQYFSPLSWLNQYTHTSTFKHIVNYNDYNSNLDFGVQLLKGIGESTWWTVSYIGEQETQLLNYLSGQIAQLAHVIYNTGLTVLEYTTKVATIIGTTTFETVEALGSFTSFVISSMVSTSAVIYGSLFKFMDAVASALHRMDPLVIDLNGNGIALDSFQKSTVLFDLNGDGVKEDTGWTKANGDDAFLVIDKNSDGKINDISELFGNADITGFAQLATYDSNGDGLINSADSQFNLLKLWNDKNANGTVDAGEMTTLAQNNITSISLNAYGNISVIRNIINKHSNLAAAANDNCVDSLFSRVKIA